MIHLRFSDDCEVSYKTLFSSGADLKSRVECVAKAGEVSIVPTGVWIDKVDWNLIPEGMIPELQIRARSGLAYKNGITLANAVGTIDADFPDEIQVLLWNFSKEDFVIKKGDRIAQIVLCLTQRIPSLAVGGKRVGGFGSTGKHDNTTQLHS